MQLNEQIKVNIPSQESEKQSSPIVVHISGPTAEEQAKEDLSNQALQIKLKISKTLDGNYIIKDHIDYDIVIYPEKKKIILFPKTHIDDRIYNSQNRLLDFLTNHGIIDREKIEGGAVCGSLEAKILDSKDFNSINVLLLVLSKYMNNEKDYIESYLSYINAIEDNITNPDEEESSEYDPDRHARRKGSLNNIMNGYTKNPYSPTPAIYRI